MSIEHIMVPPNMPGQYNCVYCGVAWPCPSAKLENECDMCFGTGMMYVLEEVNNDIQRAAFREIPCVKCENADG